MLKQQVDEAVSYLKRTASLAPDLIIQLGTGLGDLSQVISESQVIPYSEIPHFQNSTVDSHAGNLVLGTISGKNVAVLQGRLHFYEGYSAQEITLPVRVLSRLGAKKLIITNAAGGLNQSFLPGTFMIISDHINLIGDNPLRGPNIDEWGYRFPDMSEVYSTRFIEIAKSIAKREKINVSAGVYIAVPGPSLETPSETRFLQFCGADAVGMSTVPEVIVAKHAGLEILGLSIIANTNDPVNFQPILLQDVLDKIKEVMPLFNHLIVEIVKEIPQQ